MARRKTRAAAAVPDAAPRPADRPLFDDFLPHLIARLAYQLNADLIEKLRREGINVTRWRILAVLAMGDGITINEIIDRAMVQQSALSRALMRMEKENYVRRILRREDARCVEVYLTHKGRTLFNSLNIVVRRREQRLLEGFSASGIEAAFNLIRRLSRNMHSRS
jgi:DNA-binding MarR family transcriptional regulator